jgi:16S rRNA C967 or C1407 C5-methylase (RsmB/RsmF family)
MTDSLDLTRFERYRPLIDDWDAFRAALARPLPTCLRANTLRLTVEALEERLRSSGLSPRRVPWYPSAVTAEPLDGPGTRLGYVAGLYAVQEEASLLPVALLGLEELDGESARVLDLCAAPGSKTGAIAAALGNRGTVVANDRDAGRLSMVRSNLDRLGTANVTVTRFDAGNYPPEAGAFDRVLADVPCSCEGTSRKNPEILIVPPDPAGEAKLRRVQRLILEKAVKLCRPGGRVVYATCTYAPEENEAVVDAVLRSARLAGGDLRLLPASLPGLVTSPGVTTWNGREYLPELANALRVWPHQNDTGGFFVAVIEKVSGFDADLGVEPAGWLPGELTGADRESWLAPLRERFGLAPGWLDDFVLRRANRTKLAVAPRGHRPPAHPVPEVVGFPFLHTNMGAPKLTHAASLVFLEGATRNVVRVDPEQAAAYLARDSFALRPDQRRAVEGDGHVLLRLAEGNFGLGLGHARGEEVESYFPKQHVVS